MVVVLEHLMNLLLDYYLYQMIDQFSSEFKLLITCRDVTFLRNILFVVKLFNTSKMGCRHG